MKIINVIQKDDLNTHMNTNLDLHREKILLSMVRPILFGLLVDLKQEVVKDYGEGTINDVLLRQLARAYKDGPGKCGICFEYAVHSAIRNNNPLVIERIQDALSLCGIVGNKTTSILLGFEKAGVLQISNELESILTPYSRLIIGPNGRSIKIKEHINTVINVFRRRSLMKKLPPAISDIWRTDLFIGNTDSDMWVAASVKINPLALRYSRGLSIGIVPTRCDTDRACYTKDGMIVCPLLYNKGFMEYFYSAWKIVTQFIASDAHLPNEKDLYIPVERRVAKYLESMRECRVIELVDNDLKQLAHPTLIEPRIETVDIFNPPIKRVSGILIAPDPLLVPQNFGIGII